MKPSEQLRSYFVHPSADLELLILNVEDLEERFADLLDAAGSYVAAVEANNDAVDEYDALYQVLKG